MVSCQKDYDKSDCATKNINCKNVDGPGIPRGNGAVTLISWQYFPETDRFGPEFNPNNPDEVMFGLNPKDGITPDSIDKPQVVIGNIRTGEHFFVRDIPWNVRAVGMSWGKSDLVFAQSGIINLKNKNEFLSIGYNGVLAKHFWTKNDDNSFFGLVMKIFDERIKEELMGVRVLKVEYPSFEFESTDLIKEEGFSYFGLSVAPNGELSYFVDSILYLSKENTEYDEKFFVHSDADLFFDLMGVGWHPYLYKFYFLHSSGLYLIEKDNSKPILIRKSCPNRQYMNFSISPDGDKIIAQIRFVEGDWRGDYVSENHKLVIMDIDGCNEKVLFEDWDGTVVGRP